MPHATWPMEGTIKFDDISLRYSQNGALILNKISFEISNKEKVFLF
jgi:ABC-type bacteriocin/lantibiotic exporter with double-glycine peptidase domain